MSDRRTRIKRIVEGGAELACDPAAWQGEMTVSTEHTMYRFRDGQCIAVQRQESEPSRPSRSECVGMRMVGWLIGDVVSKEWRPGASAILLRPSARGDEVALTSPTVQVTREAPRKPLPTEPVMLRAPRPPSFHAATDSMTRIGVPRGR